MTVADLKIGQKGIVEGFSNSDIQVVLLELGFAIGQSLEITNKAPFKGPIAVNLGSFVLSLRQEEAKEVLIKQVQS